MSIDKNSPMHEETDPLFDQVRPEPNSELLHQHDDREDALDRAIESQEQPADDVEPSPPAEPDVAIVA